MKKNIIIMVLTAIILMGSATISADLLTVKPAQPVATVVIADYGPSTISKSVLKYAQLGYITKAVSGDGHGNFIIVMEKY